MERPRCIYSRDHVASFQCMCTNPYSFVCSECMGMHSKTPGEHLVIPIIGMVLPPPVQEVKPQTVNCENCNRAVAEDFCCCSYPVPALCKTCQMKHIQKNSGDAHYFLPISLRSKVSTRKAAALLCIYLVNLNTGKTHIQEMISRVSACQEALVARRKQLEQELMECVESQLQELEALKDVLKAGMTKGADIAKENLLESNPPDNGIAALLWQCSREQDFRNLELFKFEHVDQRVDFLKPLGVGWRSKFDASGTVAQSFTYQSKYLPTEKLVTRVQKLVQMLARPTIPQNLLVEFENKMRTLVLQQFTMEEDLMQLCENLNLYVQEAKVAPGKDELISKVLASLLRSSFDTKEMSDCSSLIYILTRQYRLPPSFVNLQTLADLTTPPSPLLGEARKDHIRVFDCDTQSWGVRTNLNRTIRVDDSSRSVFLRNGRMFITGGSIYVDLFFGEGKRNHFADAYDIDVANGTVRKLNNMNQKRSNHGMLAYFNWVYVFGGCNGDTLQSCEKYSLTTATWINIPDMNVPRHSFSPSLHQHLVYLCGGDTQESEVFDPSTETFTPLGVQLPESGPARTVVLDDELIVVTATSISKRNVKTGGEFKEQKHAKSGVFGAMSCSVVNSAGIWFVADDPKGTIRHLDLNSGGKLRDYAYPD